MQEYKLESNMFELASYCYRNKDKGCNKCILNNTCIIYVMDGLLYEALLDGGYTNIWKDKSVIRDMYKTLYNAGEI